MFKNRLTRMKDNISYQVFNYFQIIGDVVDISEKKKTESGKIYIIFTIRSKSYEDDVLCNIYLFDKSADIADVKFNIGDTIAFAGKILSKRQSNDEIKTYLCANEMMMIEVGLDEQFYEESFHKLYELYAPENVGKRIRRKKE